MNKQIPIYFDNVIIASPLEKVSESNSSMGRLEVGVFTKYGNRNGSYITDAVADMLINSAIKGDTPVIGFFDPETETWAGHTGPTLASAYGYVESFNGWRPLMDSDGVERDYAIFSVVIFTKYFKEANLIVGQNQSMELDINSIDGDWADIEGIEYFVYTKAAIMGLCVIGSHEPCFSASSFAPEQSREEAYQSQYQKFSSLLAEAKQQVEEAEKNQEGGEQPMTDEFENQETVKTPEVLAVEDNPEVVETPVVEEVVEFAQPEETVEENSELVELQNQLNELQSKYEAAETRIQELERFQAESETLRSQNEELQATISNYELQLGAIEEQRKSSLIDRYEKILNETEEISIIRAQVKDYSYDALESKLAVLFANQQLTGSDDNKVPLPEPQESQFALLMKKYRKI